MMMYAICHKHFYYRFFCVLIHRFSFDIRHKRADKLRQKNEMTNSMNDEQKRQIILSNLRK